MEQQLSPAFTQEMTVFLQYHPPARLSRNLRRMLLDYIRTELKVGTPFFFSDLIGDCYELFELLDKAAYETRDWHTDANCEPTDRFVGPPVSEDE